MYIEGWDYNRELEQINTNQMKIMTRNLLAAVKRLNSASSLGYADSNMDLMPPQMQTSMSGTGGMAPPMEYRPS